MLLGRSKGLWVVHILAILSSFLSPMAVAISAMTIPKEKISVLGSAFAPGMNCSGAINPVVPAGCLRMKNASLSDSPKSMIFTFCPVWVIMMLDGLRSRCIICLLCIYSKAFIN